MKALITGAGGFVGPHLQRHLSEMGDDVDPIDLKNGPDLRDGPKWSELIADRSPDVIYHLGGWSDVGGSWKNPSTTYEVNVMGTMSVLEGARRVGSTTVILISSADLYGIIDPQSLPITEGHPVQPRSPYGASKQSAEAAANAYWRGFGVPTIVARPFNHLGRGQGTQFAAPSFAQQIATLEKSGGGKVRHGDLSAKRDLTDVRDVVRAYRLLASSGVPGETYNVCSGTAVAMQEVFDTLVSLSDAPIKGEINPELLRPIDLPILRGSAEKLHDATGWKPDFELKSTLADVLDDARSSLDSHRIA